MLLLTLAIHHASTASLGVPPLPGGLAVTVPNPAPQAPPGLARTVNTLLAWWKWLALIAGVFGLVGCGAMMALGRRNLPPGAYVIHATGDLVNFGPSDFIRCQIMAAGVQDAAISAMAGDPTAPGARGPAGLISPYTLTGAVIVSSPAQATLRCWHDTSNGATPYADSGTTMWAHRAAALQRVNP